jgi:septum formation protein
MPRLLLASESPRRRELLELLSREFEVVAPSGVDESRVRGAAFARCEELARRKAEWVLSRKAAESGDFRVLGADTLVAVVAGSEEHIVGKPCDGDHARETLRLLSGRTHRVLSGVAVAEPGTATRSAVEVSLVTFHTLSEEEIENYVASGAAMGKAGAYGIQDEGARFVAGFRGCYYNVVGLPLRLVAHLLGLEAPADCNCDRHCLQKGQAGCRLR